MREMHATELVEWRAYYAMEPFGEAQADHRAGVLTALLANINRDPKRRSEPFAPTDFMPDRTLTPAERAAQDAPQQLSQEAFMAYIETLNAAFGGQDLRGQEAEPEAGDVAAEDAGG